MRIACLGLLLFLGVFSGFVQGATVAVENLRLWRAPDHTRLVFDLSGTLEHRVFILKNPDRLVVDLEDGRLLGALPTPDLDEPILAGIRAGSRGDNKLRIVLDLKQPARPRTLVLKPYGQYGHRLVIDLYEAKKGAPRAQTTPAKSARNYIVIAIDAGHGGEDPGAVGRRYKTREKDVVLAIAKQLKRLVDAAPNMRAVMTRKGDYYVKLIDRYKKARTNDADIFVSIHADALPGKRRARGASVYALSERGATSALARILADKHNASDLIGGVNLRDKDDLLKKVLIDLSQTATIGASVELGSSVLSELKRVGSIHIETVQQAGFAVLKAPDVTSILIETAFISTPTEEKKLRSKGYQRKLASAIFKGIKRYATRRKLADNQSGGADKRRVHVVQPGDTLSAIARLYDVHMDTLRFANNLSDNKIRIGRKLVIP